MASLTFIDRLEGLAPDAKRLVAVLCPTAGVIVSVMVLSGFF